MEKLVTFEEIAARLGITKQQAYKDYQRAIKKLQRLMKRKPELAEELQQYLDPRDEIGPRAIPASRQWIAKTVSHDGVGG